MTLPPAHLLARWRLTNLERIAETATSIVWRVDQPDGQTAVLKLLHPGEEEEALGATYLQSLEGQGVVQVYSRHNTAILMEFCSGPSLGDLARNSADREATEILCDVIQTLHAACPVTTGLQPLATRFAPLTTAALSGDLADAAVIARNLLAAPVQPVALHGDLHHDNVLQSHRGWLAIDPKGILGDPAYEPANAFRNPEGAGELIINPDRITHLAGRFSQRLGRPRQRLLGWAAAHCALSILWSREVGRNPTEDVCLLPVLLTAHASTAS